MPAIKELSRGVISKIVHCHLWDIVRYRDYNNFSKNFIVSRFVFPRVKFVFLTFDSRFYSLELV